MIPIVILQFKRFVKAPVILYRASKPWFRAMMSKKETVPSSNLYWGKRKYCILEYRSRSYRMSGSFQRVPGIWQACTGLYLSDMFAVCT